MVGAPQAFDPEGFGMRKVSGAIVAEWLALLEQERGERVSKTPRNRIISCGRKRCFSGTELTCFLA